MDLILITLLLCLSAFFSGSESAIFSIRWWRINYLRHEAGRSGKILANLMERPKAVLITILLGNTLVNVGASSLSEHKLENLFPDQGLWIAIAAMTLILLVIGEITPKTLAIRKPERIAMLAARPIRLFSQLIFPVRIILERISDMVTPHYDSDQKGKGRIDFLTLVDESRRADIIDESEHSVLKRILYMNTINIRDVMIPRTDIIALPDTMDFDEAVHAMLRYDFRRMPVYHESLDNIVGVLYAKDLLGGWLNPVLRRSPKALSRTPLYVPGFVNLKQLFNELSQHQRHLAIVLDEYGGTAGLVTHDDILRTIFPSTSHNEGDSWILATIADGWEVDARISWTVLSKLMNVSPDRTEFRTLNGFLLDFFGKVPNAGDEAIIELPGQHGTVPWKMEILETSSIRIQSVRITTVKDDLVTV